MALTDYEAWDSGEGTNPPEGYGVEFGINALGVGDCNNDGVFDNYDIDCFIEIICQTCQSGICEEGDSAQRGPPEAEAARELLAALRAMFE